MRHQTKLIIFRSMPDLVYWPKVKIGKKGLGYKVTSVTKRYICHEDFNRTLIIAPYMWNNYEGKYFCTLLNGEILRRDGDDGYVTTFLEEHEQAWTKNCSNTVWTRNQSDGVCEFYDASVKSFNRSSCLKLRCFICALDNRRLTFQIKSTWRPNDPGKVGKFTLKNDDYGGFVFAGNERDCFIRGWPLQIDEQLGSSQVTIARQPRKWFIPGIANFTRTINGIDLNSQVQTKISNVSLRMTLRFLFGIE